MRLSRIILLAGLSIMVSISFADQPAGNTEYKIIKQQKVGGVGGFDYVYADSDGRKLYVPRSAGRGGGAGVVSRVDVYDLDTLAPVGKVSPTNGVHGAAVDPKSGHGFASSSPVVMFDTKTFETIKAIIGCELPQTRDG